MATSFHGFVGQKRVVSHIKAQLEGAQALNQPCPNLLFIGPSGMGKTRLAKALAQEAGTDCRVIHGKANLKDLCENLIPMIKNDVLLLDEAHTLPREVQEALYEVMDTGVLTNRLSASALAKLSVSIKTDPKGKIILQPITFVCATNTPSGLLKALRRRLITIYLQAYNKADLMDIAKQEASKKHLLFSSQALKWLALSSQGQPSKIVDTIAGIQRLMYGDLNRELTRKDLFAYLRRVGKNPRGLDQEQQQYMRILKRCEKMSLEGMAGQLGLEAEYVLTEVEPGLIRLGFMYKGGGGRHLTERGKSWTREDKALNLYKKKLKVKKEDTAREFKHWSPTI